MNAGELVIKTVLDNSKFKKQYNELEKQANSKEIDIKVTSENIKQLEKDLEIATKKQQELFKQYEDAVAKRSSIDPYDAFGKGLTGDEMTYYDNVIESLERRMKDELKPSAEDISKELEKQRNILLKQEDDYDKIRQKMEQIKIDSIHQAFGKVRNSIGDAIKSIGRMGLAVLGIRGAFGLVRNAISQIASENEQLKTQLDFMKYALANAIKPVVEFLVKMLYKIMVFIGGLIKFFTGKNIFSKTLAQDFASANKSAKELRKTLAGFDEMNVLNQNGKSGGGGISVNLDGIGDLHKEVEGMGNSIKKYFFAGEDSLGEGIKKTIKEVPGMLIETLNPVNKIVYKYGIEPTKVQLLELSEMLKPIWKPLEQAFIDTYNRIKETLKPFIDWFNTNIFTKLKEKWNEFKTEFLKAYAPFINKIIDAINRTFGIFGVHIDYIETDSEEAGESLEENIVGALDEISSSASEISQTDYKVNFITSSVDTIKNGLKSIWDYLTGLTTKKWNISAIFGGSSKGGLFGAKGLIYYNRLPKLASGGIVNQPGRGIPYRGATIGERGAEAVVPLTDSQQMELLGASIGKYITVMNTNPIYMNGRLIAKEINRSNAEDDFAFNR